MIWAQRGVWCKCVKVPKEGWTDIDSGERATNPVELGEVLRINKVDLHKGLVFLGFAPRHSGEFFDARKFVPLSESDKELFEGLAQEAPLAEQERKLEELWDARNRA